MIRCLGHEQRGDVIARFPAEQRQMRLKIPYIVHDVVSRWNVGWIAHEDERFLQIHDGSEAISFPEFNPIRSLVTFRIHSSDIECVWRNIRCDDPQIRPLQCERDSNAAASGSNIDDRCLVAGRRPALCFCSDDDNPLINLIHRVLWMIEELQRTSHHSLRSRTRDQDPTVDGERAAVEFLRANDVRDRLMRTPALDRLHEQRPVRRYEFGIAMRKKPRAVFAENMAQKHLCIRRRKPGTLQCLFDGHGAIMPDMTTIGIDCRFAGTQTGLGRYTRELTSHLLKRTDPVQYVLFVSAGDHTWVPKNPLTHFSLFTFHSPHYSFSEQLFFPNLIRRSGIDLLFSPHFNVPLLCPVPFVATIHDLILHRYPNQAPRMKRLAYRVVMRHAIQASRALIAVSAFTASEIMHEYGKELREKITVIHEAASDEFARKSAAASGPVLKKYSLSKPFFLYVGSCKEHKNVQMLIDAYRSLGSTDTELVLVTGGKETDALQLCDGVRVLRAVPDADLPSLYFFAVSFVTASLYEGFGLPVLEAAASGCPVIVTNRGALPEIAPASARIVEPTVEDLADALREPPQPSESGAMRSWGEVAEETSKILSLAAQ